MLLVIGLIASGECADVPAVHCSDSGDPPSIDQYRREAPIPDKGQDSRGVDDGPEQREDKDLGCRNRQGRQVGHVLLVASLPLHAEETRIKTTTKRARL